MPETKTVDFYLASQSPRRKQLLTDWGYSFDIVKNSPIPSVVEDVRSGELPVGFVKRMTEEKALWGWESVKALKWKQKPVLASDTIVAYENRILGKPKTQEEAAEFLELLSGTSHQVYTGVALAMPDRSLKYALSASTVYFKKLKREEILAYVKSGEPLDKAGAYGIQGLGGSFVLSISGSFTGIMGLPMLETVELLKGIGIPIFKEII